MPTEALRSSFLKSTHWRMLIVGSPGAGMFMHKDVMRMGGWQAQIRGRKRWHLCYGPTQDKFMYKAGETDGFRPDYAKTPRFADATCYDFVTKPGDVLLWPRDWWHQTIVLGPSDRRSKRRRRKHLHAAEAVRAERTAATVAEHVTGEWTEAGERLDDFDKKGVSGMPLLYETSYVDPIDSEISVSFSGSIVNADNCHEVRRQLEAECGDGSHMIHVSEETCAHLPKCYTLWEHEFGGC